MVQEHLAKELLRTRVFTDRALFTDLPDGTLELAGAVWSFRRHGAGVGFRSSAGVVVDAHIGLLAAPRGIDAWRLLSYAESRGIEELTWNGKHFAVADEATMEAALKQMLSDGALASERVDGRLLYFPSSGDVDGSGQGKAP